MPHFLIIAASSEIGQKLVKNLIQLGHTVFTTARNDSKIKPDLYLDASNFEDVENAFIKAGNIDGVVNLSGSLLIRPAHLTTRAQYEELVNSSFTTAFATVRAAGKLMTKGGSVVLISSAAAKIGLANHEGIAAVKSAIVGLVISAAATYSSLALRFNAIAPGLVETSLTKEITQNPMSRKFSESMHALKRLGSTDDIASAIIFLLDPSNSWITGQVLAVDGGLSSVRSKTQI